MPKNGGSAKPEPRLLKFGGPEPLGPIEVYAYAHKEDLYMSMRLVMSSTQPINLIYRLGGGNVGCLNSVLWILG